MLDMKVEFLLSVLATQPTVGLGKLNLSSIQSCPDSHANWAVGGSIWVGFL